MILSISADGASGSYQITLPPCSSEWSSGPIDGGESYEPAGTVGSSCGPDVGGTEGYVDRSGSSLLLPNEDLDPGFQKWDLSAGYQLHPRVRGYMSVENLLDKEYAASYGFPSLPRTARVGATITLGGDR